MTAIPCGRLIIAQKETLNNVLNIHDMILTPNCPCPCDFPVLSTRHPIAPTYYSNLYSIHMDIDTMNSTLVPWLSPPMFALGALRT